MFNGIIYSTGTIRKIFKKKKSLFIGIKSNLKFRQNEIGSSVNCNGVCLTLTKIQKNIIYFYISNETIDRSNFKKTKIGQVINLEKSLIYGQKISGHFTQGHVDTTAKIKKISIVDNSWSMKLEINNKKFMKFLEEKASISINGVSLTISKVYKKRGGPIPARVDNSPKLNVPKIEIFNELLSGSSDRSISTTMAFIRLLTILTKDKSIGKNIVPIVPDEARTFGMDPLFRQIGIYAHSGQLYEPVDSDQFLYYKEEKNGQILEEGINEGGSISSFNASGSSYANHGIKTIPFYIFYSMFGYQRIWDFIWAGADMRVRGFLLGGTAGRTTLNGEGLQHQDGHSHVAAAATPNTKAYDCAFSYEIATVVHQGLIEMCEKDKDVIYYLTLENENYVHPPMPDNAIDGIIKGLYRFMPETDPEVSLFGSGPLMGEVIEANKLLKEDWDIRSDIWSVTSYSEIRKDAESTSRWNMNHPNENPKVSFLNSTISNNEIPIVAVSDYIKMVPNQISPYIKNPFCVLGTDGFGRSDTRESLRKFFEIDRYYIVLNSIKALVDQGKIKKSVIEKVMNKYNIDSEKPDPINS